MNEHIYKALTVIAEDIIELVRRVLASDDVGVNLKVDKNTLKDSNLYKEIETDVDNSNPVVYMLLNQYVEYVERGRERYHTPKVPIDALRDWAVRKGIGSDNSTLFAIQRSIYNLGIRPRPILYYVFEELDELFEKEYFDRIFDSIIKEIEEYFN
ncbi:hypothetical protein [Bacteroides sp. 51]|uniref:hypothetical protein n=1 Tax=Bacteroides sp. 51 TaxID=2302938 RepID=UPI0013CF4B90|nr:hypothetical protein [Bacteroides sp. 51]NDV83959.1 hypothetical protein [Bacteroides sp. 51]